MASNRGIRKSFELVKPTTAEVDAVLPGDAIVPDPDVVMDRAFTLAGAPDEVWPWILQLGKNRSGWYLPRSVERFIPRARRATRKIEPELQGLKVGDVIQDWGGKEETFEVAEIEPPRSLVHRSTRGQINVSWNIFLTELPGEETRVHLRLRLAPVKRQWLVNSGGDFFDLATIAGLAAGLRDRLGSPHSDD